jgi:type VI secretion system secreted protein VgrG
MSQTLTILLHDITSDSNLGFVFTDVNIQSSISGNMLFELECQYLGDFEESCNRLDNIDDVTLNFDGEFGNLHFDLYLSDYSVSMTPNKDVLTIQLKLTDRWNRFRELTQTGVYYYSNIKDIYNELYKSGLSQVLNSNIQPQLYFDPANTNKYTTHPIYLHYKETHWDFLKRALLEHGLNYHWITTDMPVS